LGLAMGASPTAGDAGLTITHPRMREQFILGAYTELNVTTTYIFSMITLTRELWIR